MGLVFNNNTVKNTLNNEKYISFAPCRKNFSRQRKVKALTRQNIQFLRNQGLKVVVPVGKSLV